MVFFMLLVLTTAADFVSCWHTINLGYTGVYGNLNISFSARWSLEHMVYGHILTLSCSLHLDTLHLSLNVMMIKIVQNSSFRGNL